MIVTEPYTEVAGLDLVRTYSDRGMLIHGGFPEADYVEAIDPVDAHRTYTETNIPVESDDEISDSEALAIITGEGSDPT